MAGLLLTEDVLRLFMWHLLWRYLRAAFLLLIVQFPTLQHMWLVTDDP